MDVDNAASVLLYVAAAYIGLTAIAGVVGVGFVFAIYRRYFK